ASGSTSDPGPGAGDAAAPATSPAAAPATSPAAAPATGGADAPDAVQELPLTDAAPPPSGSAGRKPAPARKAPPRKAPESKAPAKRAAAAVTETAARQVVPVRPGGPSGSMPPTDLDVVDVS